MTISTLVKLNRANGGKFFERETLKFWGDTLKSFGVRRGIDKNNVELTRKRTGATWLFKGETGRLICPLKTGGKRA